MKETVLTKYKYNEKYEIHAGHTIYRIKDKATGETLCSCTKENKAAFILSKLPKK